MVFNTGSLIIALNNNLISYIYIYIYIIWSVQCFCGNSYGKYNKNNDSVCYMNCAGDKLTKCGASYKNSVYEIVYQTTTQRPSTTVITSLSSNINLNKNK